MAKEGCNSTYKNGESTISVDLFNRLPEGCISNTVSLTSPRDACRLSLVASIFRSAAESDAVWESFLPSDYQDIIARSVKPSCREIQLLFASKKRLYLHLCDHPIIIDDNTKSFSLEKCSGKKCYMLGARNLSIAWADTPRYWKWTSLPESRFPEVAELLSVCWLEIRGKINTCMLSQDTVYVAYLVFMTTSMSYGFEYQPAEVSVGVSGGQTDTRIVYLDPERGQRQTYHIVPRRIGIFNHRDLNRPRPQVNDDQYPKQRRDGWLEVELGEYINKGGEDGELEMNLTEVKGGDWKSGLIIQGIEIRPKA